MKQYNLRKRGTKAKATKARQHCISALSSSRVNQFSRLPPRRSPCNRGSHDTDSMPVPESNEPSISTNVNATTDHDMREARNEKENERVTQTYLSRHTVPPLVTRDDGSGDTTSADTTETFEYKKPIQRCQDILKKTLERGDIEYHTPTLLTKHVNIPEECMKQIPNGFTWATPDKDLQKKEISEKDKIWSVLEKGDHIAKGHFTSMDDFSDEKQKDFFHEMVDKRLFSMYSEDGLSIHRQIFSGEVASQLSKEIISEYVGNYNLYIQELEKKERCKTRLRIVKTEAKEDFTGGTSLHADRVNPNLEKPWDLRCIGTFGSWVKMFGFTESCAKDDPIYMKLLSHGSFVILDKYSSGVEPMEDGTRFKHAANLLPKADEIDGASIYTFVLDIYLNEDYEGVVWETPQELLAWMKEKGFAMRD
ncbi:predicted protein [Chaetoceros tenuissimus]|uniref:Uncharacterized protein n=1 Tax=Chaetoceros tenuissimus TaxID=426638 RepID=A0AAD3D479_9STRA|nr:predicted protein [Chaetoceros tenuissimus]